MKWIKFRLKRLRTIPNWMCGVAMVVCHCGCEFCIGCADSDKNDQSVCPKCGSTKGYLTLVDYSNYGQYSGLGKVAEWIRILIGRGIDFTK